MKIAIIVTKFPSISETFIMEQIVGVVEAAHHVEIFANIGKQAQKEHPDIEKFDLKKSVHYFPKIPQNKAVRILKALLLAIINLYKDPILIIMALNIIRFRTVRHIYIIVPFLGKKFDVIHCHFGPNGIIGADLKMLGVAGKILTSFHGYDVNSYPQTYGKDVYKGLFTMGDFFTANTQFTKQQAVSLGAAAKKIDILHEGLRIERFQFSQKILQPEEKIKLLSIGRLVEKKGHKYALEAIAKVLKKNRGIQYTIAGDGPLRDELESLTESLGITEQVTFTGSIDQKEAIRLYSQAHIFLLPSVTTSDYDREGQALVLQEAQACGLPVLSTLHNGIPEGVINGKSAFLVPEKDSEALAEKLEYLICNPQLWKEMGTAGRRFIEETFASKKLNQQLIEIYNKIISF